MGSFELLFACRMADGSIATLTRVIAAEDRQMAIRIGHAMRGELAGLGVWLDHFIYAIPASWYGPWRPVLTPTMAEPIMGSLISWRRVLLMLGLEENSVKWVYGCRDCDVAQPGEIVGFFPWSASEAVP